MKPLERRMKQVIEAARNADWMQVALNGGPPCFHIGTDGSFCFRAERWAGHDVYVLHRFIPLHELLETLGDKNDD